MQRKDSARESARQIGLDVLHRLQPDRDPDQPFTDAGGGITLMGYNPLGLTTLVRDARNNATAYSYDGLGNLLSQTSPDTGMTTFAYNSVGQRTQMQRADLATTAYTYDTLGRLKTIASGGQTRTLTYDGCTNGKGLLCSGLAVSIHARHR